MWAPWVLPMAPVRAGDGGGSGSSSASGSGSSSASGEAPWSSIENAGPATSFVGAAGSIDPSDGRWSVADTVLPSVSLLTDYDGGVAAAVYWRSSMNGTAAILRWDGFAWADYHRPLAGSLTTLALAGHGRLLYAAGANATNVLSTSVAVARWNGAEWTSVGVMEARLTSPRITALAMFRGTLVAAGAFTIADGAAASNIAALNPATGAWAPLAQGIDQAATALLVHNDALVVGGYLAVAGEVFAPAIARWDGSTWSALGEGLDAPVTALATFNGSLVAAHIDGSTLSARVAVWDGAVWTALVGAVQPAFLPWTRILALATFTTTGGTSVLIAGGAFLIAGNVTAYSIARWTDADAWTALGSPAGVGLGGAVFALYTPTCPLGRTGVAPACPSCGLGFFGANCTACSSCAGTCYDGLDGNCTCSFPWAGPTCTDCAPGWAGPACSACAPGYFGATCQPCSDCAPNGVCREGLDGGCDCTAPYEGPTCAERSPEQALIPVFGVVAIAGSLMVGMGIVGYAILSKFGTFGAHGATAQERLPLQPRHP